MYGYVHEVLSQRYLVALRHLVCAVLKLIASISLVLMLLITRSFFLMKDLYASQLGRLVICWENSLPLIETYKLTI